MTTKGNHGGAGQARHESFDNGRRAGGTVLALGVLFVLAAAVPALENSQTREDTATATAGTATTPVPPIFMGSQPAPTPDQRT